jgi:hypothetical protein
VAHDGVVDQLKRLGNGLFLSKSKEDNFVYVWDQNSSEPVKGIVNAFEFALYLLF